ncbi:hypothetical protein TKK_0005574 [Trichogramma kaykai]|uniref:HTH CENPB-type domain-containing protein n=1 Tax=Trichogramma kaykai TaxID=54128 RepID=A0ABD2XHM1_9HYME
MSQKSKRLSLVDKVAIIQELQIVNMSYREAGEKFGVAKKKFKKTGGVTIDSLTYEWFCRARAHNIPVSGVLIQEKAREIAAELLKETQHDRLADFKASYGWLTKFSIRHKIAYKIISGEAASVDQGTIDQWKVILKDFSST